MSYLANVCIVSILSNLASSVKFTFESVLNHKNQKDFDYLQFKSAMWSLFFVVEDFVGCWGWLFFLTFFYVIKEVEFFILAKLMFLGNCSDSPVRVRNINRTRLPAFSLLLFVYETDVF
jgi:hypothetical protein